MALLWSVSQCKAAMLAEVKIHAVILPGSE
jgi:hypothetical protein